MHAKQDGAAVLLLGDIAHMNERGIEDQLVVVNLLAGDDEAEGSDKPLTRRFWFQRAFAHIEVSCLTLHVLAALGAVSQQVVEGLGTESAGDDHRQTKFLAKRFQSARTEAAKVFDSLLRRIVLDAVLDGRGALGELIQAEVRR